MVNSNDTNTPEQQYNPPTFTTLLELLKQQAEVNFRETTANSLKAIYNIAIKTDLTLKADRCPTGSAANIKRHWEMLVVKRKINENSKMLDAVQTPDMKKFIDNPNLMIYTKQAWDKMHGKNNANNANNTNQPPAKVTFSDQQDQSTTKSVEAILNNSIIPTNVKAIHDRYRNEKNNDDSSSEEDDGQGTLGEFGLFRKNMNNMFDNLEKKIKADMKKLESKVTNNSGTCVEIRNITTNNSRRIDDTSTSVAEVKTDITKLKNNELVLALGLDNVTKALKGLDPNLAIENAPGLSNLAAKASDGSGLSNLAISAPVSSRAAAQPTTHQLMQYFQQAVINRKDYQTTVRNNLKSAIFVMIIRNDKTEIYTADDEAESSGKRLRGRQVELTLNCDVHIKDHRVFKIGERAYGAVFSLDCTTVNQRLTKGNAIIAGRNNHSDDFGLRREVPQKYNIEKFLIYLKTLKDPSSGTAVILGFDTTRMGYYKIYVNDARLNGWTENDKTDDGKPVREKTKCTYILPWNPKDFIDIEEKNFTIANLLLLADSKNYFCYAGNVWPIPDAFKATKPIANDGNFGGSDIRHSETNNAENPIGGSVMANWNDEEL